MYSAINGYLIVIEIRDYLLCTLNIETPEPYSSP